jgi:hypothetical protein
VWGFLKKRRRERLGREAFPAEWLRILEQRFPYYRLLSREEQTRLQLLIRCFLEQVKFEGCGGLTMTDEIRVTIAAQASILLLNRDEDVYPGLQSVLVYPTAYSVPSQHVDDVGVVHEGYDTHLGEAWERGAIILSWDDVRRDTAETSDGQNVTLHEFAHQLDQQDGSFDGAPLLDTQAHYRSWARILMKEYTALQRAVERGEMSLLDQFGATDPAEFFAVVTEAFFEKPKALKASHPQLYAELMKFYRQDPTARGY